MIVVLVACGHRKRPAGLWPARDLYTGNLYVAQRDYAEAVGDEWAILSARHHLLDPTTEVAPYNARMADFDEDELHAWQQRVRTEVDARWPVGTLDQLIVTTGRNYRAALADRPDYWCPWDDMADARFIFQMPWLRTHTREAIAR